MKIDVGQYRRHYAHLRSPGFGIDDSPVPLQDTGLQQFADQARNRPIIDVPVKHRYSYVYAREHAKATRYLGAVSGSGCNIRADLHNFSILKPDHLQATAAAFPYYRNRQHKQWTGTQENENGRGFDLSMKPEANAYTTEKDEESTMELSTLLIAVVFIMPIALGLILLGAMASDNLPAGTVTRNKRAQAPATKTRSEGDIGHYLPA